MTAEKRHNNIIKSDAEKLIISVIEQIGYKAGRVVIDYNAFTNEIKICYLSKKINGKEHNIVI